MSIVFTLLGTGSSGGVPRVGSGWGACDPANPRNRRRRCALLVQRFGPEGVTNLLVDTGPDLREQLLGVNLTYLDGVIITHDHADHTHGIDDIRPMALHMRRRIDVYMDADTRRGVMNRFSYCFESPQGSGYPPIGNLHVVELDEHFHVTGAGGDIVVMPFQVGHGEINCMALRIAGVCYMPDVKIIPAEAEHHLAGLECWIIDSLRPSPHPSHFSLSDALSWIERIKPRQAILTNLHNDLDYATLSASLPQHISAAYDGLSVTIHEP